MWSERTEQKLNTLREQILLSLPHELRTPLTSIMGYSELLMDNEDSLPPDEIVQIGTSIYRSALRLHRLVENYLIYVQINLISQNPAILERLLVSGTAEPHILIAAQASQIAQRHNRENDLYLELDEIPQVMILDEYLGKVVEELVDNAFKFSSPGTPVYVRMLHYNTCCLLEIEDQGRGMSDEQIAAIGAYMQFDRKHYEQQGGGFGLIIAKRLVELHQGQFTVASAAHKGTTVRIVLP
jgi:signal transduction histidine kinase